MKPIIRKSKSLLSKLKKWKPFTVSTDDSGQTFMNLSLRLAGLGALLCDSEQDFLNLSLRCLEADTVFRPGSKMIIRTFLKDILVEDVTLLSLFPKVNLYPSSFCDIWLHCLLFHSRFVRSTPFVWLSDVCVGALLFFFPA